MVFNVAAVGLYWLARVPKGEKRKEVRMLFRCENRGKAKKKKRN